MNDTNNFGLKIVDKNPAEFESVLDYVISTGSPLEIGCYFNEPAALERIVERLDGSSVRVNVHSNQNRMHIHNLHDTYPAFATHIVQAQHLGSRYSIAHVSNYPMTTRLSRATALRQRLSDNLLRAEALCEHYDYRIHLENDFQPIAFYRHLFEHIHDLGLQRLHFCLDVGHAKLWSSEKLTDWLDFAEELQKSGFSIHGHLHANSGFGDEHLSIAEARARGIADPDDDYNPFGYPQAYWEVDRRLPEAIKIFEVKTHEAIANHRETLAAKPASRMNGLP